MISVPVCLTKRNKNKKLFTPFLCMASRVYCTHFEQNKGMKRMIEETDNTV